MDAYIRSWHEKLRKECEVASQPAMDSQRQSLETQIKALLSGLPPALLNRPWAIEEVVERLQGKYREHPHPQNVAAVLKRLGWKQIRDWTRAGQGRRYWLVDGKARAVEGSTDPKTSKGKNRGSQKIYGFPGD